MFHRRDGLRGCGELVHQLWEHGTEPVPADHEPDDDAVADGDTHTDADPSPDADTEADPNADADPGPDANAGADTDTCANPNPNPDADPDTNAGANTDADSNPNADSNTHAYTDADTHTVSADRVEPDRRGGGEQRWVPALGAPLVHLHRDGSWLLRNLLRYRRQTDPGHSVSDVWGCKWRHLYSDRRESRGCHGFCADHGDGQSRQHRDRKSHISHMSSLRHGG
jgi:hypothetical protein